MTDSVALPDLGSEFSMKVLIFGSCVTRDAFAEDFTAVSLSKYYARSSMASAFSGSVFPVKADSLPSVEEFRSRFSWRMTVAEVTRAFQDELKTSSADAVVIDFIDERLKLFKSQGELAVASPEWLEAGAPPLPELEPEEVLGEWEEGFQRFLEIAKSTNHAVILNAVWFASMSESGREFPPLYVKRHNDLLAWKYERARQAGIYVIEHETVIGMPGHRWGETPYHYTEDTYDHIRSELTKLSTIVAQPIL